MHKNDHDQVLNEIERMLFDFDYHLGLLSTSMRSGFHRAQMAGSGFGFERTTRFESDPDPRRINWRESVANLDLRVNQFREEHALSVIWIDDMSASSFFGRKMTRLASLRAIMSFAAGKHRDFFGAIGVTDVVESEVTFPPGDYKGRTLEIARATLSFSKQRPGGGLLLAVPLVPQKPSLVFLVSDFLDDRTYYDQVLTALRRHYIVPIVLRDIREAHCISTAGMVEFQDIESGITKSLFVRKNTLARFEAERNKSDRALEELFRHHHTEPLWLKDDDSDVAHFMHYFEGRED